MVEGWQSGWTGDSIMVPKEVLLTRQLIKQAVSSFLLFCSCLVVLYDAADYFLNFLFFFTKFQYQNIYRQLTVSLIIKVQIWAHWKAYVHVHHISKQYGNATFFPSPRFKNLGDKMIIFTHKKIITDMSLFPPPSKKIKKVVNKHMADAQFYRFCLEDAVFKIISHV